LMIDVDDEENLYTGCSIIIKGNRQKDRRYLIGRSCRMLRENSYSTNKEQNYCDGEQTRFVSRLRCSVTLVKS
jgi:hypothetical protein